MTVNTQELLSLVEAAFDVLKEAVAKNPEGKGIVISRTGESLNPSDLEGAKHRVLSLVPGPGMITLSEDYLLELIKLHSRTDPNKEPCVKGLTRQAYLEECHQFQINDISIPLPTPLLLEDDTVLCAQDRK